MNTIWALKPGLKVLGFCGYSPFRITNENRLELSETHRNYSLFLTIAFAALSVYSFFFEQLENYVESTVRFIVVVLVYFAVLFSLFESVWKRTDQLEMLNNFNSIDQILQMRFSHKTQLSLRRNWNRVMFSHFGLLLVILIVDLAVLVLTNSSADAFYYLAFYYLPYWLSSLRYLQIIYFTWMIKTRLSFLNDTLTNMVKQKNGTIKTISFNTIQTIRFLNMDLGVNKNKVAPMDQRWALESTDPELMAMDVLRDVYNKLWINSQLFNKAFGLSLLCNIGFDFLSLTTDLYWIIVSFSTVVANISPTPTLYASTVNAIPHFVNVLVICGMCHYTMLVAKDVALLNNKFDHECLTDAENFWVQQFSLQMIHQRVFFSANGFFEIDFTLLFAIVGACTTYLVILVQFRMSEFTNLPPATTVAA